MQARLLLQDGTLFTGTAFGAEGEKTGEVVFNTGITGYQEVLTDSSPLHAVVSTALFLLLSQLTCIATGSCHGPAECFAKRNLATRRIFVLAAWSEPRFRFR